MSQSDSENSDTPKRRFELEVEDDDTKAAFSKGDKDAKRDKKPPMESSMQGEGNNFPLEIRFNTRFLKSLPASKVKSYLPSRVKSEVTNKPTKSEDL